MSNDPSIITTVLMIGLIWLSCVLTYQQVMLTIRRELKQACGNQLPEPVVAVCWWLYWQYVQWQQDNSQPDDEILVVDMDLDGDDDVSDGWTP